MRLCKFCQQEAPYKPLQQMEDHGVDVHFCDTCQAEYLYWKDGDHRLSWSLYVKINDRLYRWTHSSADTAQLWWVKNPGIPGTRANQDLQLVYNCGFKNSQQFTSIPELNPQNAVEKVKLLLVFS